jgi:putative DNA primase/helicase
MTNKNYLADFKKAIQAEGFTPPDSIVADGKFHRFSSNGQKNDDAGWYVFYNGKIPSGSFGCWRLGETYPWRADLGRPLTEEENSEYKKHIEAICKQQKEQEKARRKEARKKAKMILEASEIASDEHPYLAHKNVKSYGLFISHEKLVIPLYDENEELHSLQFIDFEGDKRFLGGGRTQGCFHLIGEPRETLCIAEGYATAATIHEATGFAVAIAFNAGNLLPVAKALRKKYPEISLIICADDDHITKGNPGLTKAKEAARAIDAHIAVPVFNEPRDAKATDFNDMAVAQGLDAINKLIHSSYESNVVDVTNVSTNKYSELDETPTGTPNDSDVTNDDEIPNIDKRPCYKVFEDWKEADGRKWRPGVWYFGTKTYSGETLPVEFWVCSPLYVEAIVRDSQENNFGRLLRFQNSLGNWREWSMPMELLRGSGEQLRGEILAMGVNISPQGHKLLADYLQWRTPKKAMRCALQVGWCDDSFVLPDIVIGKNASQVIFQSGERATEEHTQAGELRAWKAEIAERATGNPLLMLAISAGFAGPLLEKCNAESGGIHFVGDSSTGKTTAIEAACSVWGGRNFRRSWRATSNGMEGVAALFNDCLLALDEISECDPREVGAIVYALANGRGKQRASRTGHARSITRWLCSVVSSGERTISTTMAEGGYRIKAGQIVRLLDVPATRKYGAWDNLHGFNNGAAFSDAIRKAVSANHGKAGRAFLEKLTLDKQDFSERLESIKLMPGFSLETGHGQDKRVAARFALIGMAGEIATEYGLTGWPTGEALQAATIGLQAWRSMRGGSNNDERNAIPNQILEFIEKHGDSRFSNSKTDTNVRERAGWWEDKDDERIYYFTSAGLREALQGFDFKRALDVLQELGIFPLPTSSGERAIPKRFNGRQIKVYIVEANKLDSFETTVTFASDAVTLPVAAKKRKLKDDTFVTDVTSEKTEKPKKYKRQIKTGTSSKPLK